MAILMTWDRTKDLDEVLQIHNVFLNVSKGQTAKEIDLKEAFGTTDLDKVILEILQKGELQVNSEERVQQLSMVTREVATIVADKCVNPRTKTPYPVGMIEQALSELHFSPNLTKPAKVQALEMIKKLEGQSKFPIARAQMRLQVRMPGEDANKFEQQIRPLMASVESEDKDQSEINVICLIDPGQFRVMTETVAKITKGRGSVLVHSLKDLKDSSNL